MQEACSLIRILVHSFKGEDYAIITLSTGQTSTDSDRVRDLFSLPGDLQPRRSHFDPELSVVERTFYVVIYSHNVSSNRR